MNSRLSQVGTETFPASVSGLPVRPHILPLNPVDNVLGEAREPSASASSALADALRDRPSEEHSADDSGPLAARQPRKAPSPEDPTPEEVESHQLSGHACFRSWCRHCVRGRGSEAAHSSSQPPSSALPVISWDYYFLSTLGTDADEAAGASAEARAWYPPTWSA